MSLEEAARAGKEARMYLGLTDDEIDLLRKVGEILSGRLDRILEEGLKAIADNDEAMEILRKAGVSVEKARELLRNWLELVFNGGYDENHAAMLFRIGLAHARSGVSEKLVELQMGVFTAAIVREADEAGASPRELEALVKALFWNLVLVCHSYRVACKKSVEKTAGISPKLFERLIAVSAEEIYNELASQL